MTEIKHTPGPWAVGDSGCNVYYLNPQIEAGDEDIDDPRHDSVICDTRNIAYDPAFSGIPDGELRGNARLIAAAPDLLAACQLAAAGRPEIGLDRYVVGVLKAAIAKATLPAEQRSEGGE